MNFSRFRPARNPPIQKSPDSDLQISKCAHSWKQFDHISNSKIGHNNNYVLQSKLEVVQDDGK
jgi:hypothetical protein